MSAQPAPLPTLRRPHEGPLRVAFLFPGQGEKRVDAQLRAAVRSPLGRELLDNTADTVRLPLAQLEKKPSLLDRTEIYQPVMVALSFAALAALREAGIEPQAVLGHSLGELTAFAAVGGVSASDAIAIAALRGSLMAREAALHPGAMVAVKTADQSLIDAALAEGERHGVLSLAARNAPDEVVFSGDLAAVRAVLSSAGDCALRLPVAGAWHSPKMKGAISELRDALDKLPRSGEGLGASFITNRTGEVAGLEEDVPLLLSEQLVRPIEWTKAIKTLCSLADVVVTVGPAAVLRSLLHRNIRPTTYRIPIYSTEDERSLVETVTALSKAAFV